MRDKVAIFSEDSIGDLESDMLLFLARTGITEINSVSMTYGNSKNRCLINYNATSDDSDPYDEFQAIAQTDGSMSDLEKQVNSAISDAQNANTSRIPVAFDVTTANSKHRIAVVFGPAALAPDGLDPTQTFQAEALKANGADDLQDKVNSFLGGLYPDDGSYTPSIVDVRYCYGDNGKNRAWVIYGKPA